MNNKQSEIRVTALAQADRADWEALYHGYAVFYKVPMDDRILDTVWGWIHDADNFFRFARQGCCGLCARPDALSANAITVARGTGRLSG